MKNTLIFSLALFTLNSAWAQIKDTTSVTPDMIIYELPGQRTYNSKTYYNPKDDTYIAHLSAGPIHYEAADGSFREINTQLRPDTSGRQGIEEGLYQVRFNDRNSKANEYDVALVVPKPVQRKFHDPGKPPAPPTCLSWKILSLGYFDTQSKGYQVIQNARSVAPAVTSDPQQTTSNQLSYPQVFPGIDVRYTCQNVRAKEEFVLSQSGRNNLPDPTQYGISRDHAYLMIAIEFDVQPRSLKAFANLPEGKIEINPGNRYTFEGDDPIDFEDEDSTRHFFFAKDYAWAAADEEQRTSIKRYFYSDQNKHYLLAGVSWSWVNTAPAGTLIIDPTVSPLASDDVWLEGTINNNTLSLLKVGKYAGTNKKRTIIKFNTSGIPPTATVLNAQMKLYYHLASNGGSGAWVDRWVPKRRDQLLVNWDEAQATKDNRLTGTPWNVAYVGLDNIDAKSTFESTILFQQNAPRWQSWDLSALTKKWIDTPASNYGVVLWATNETTDGYDLQFYSSEASTPLDIYRPYLQVTYSTQTKIVYFLKDHLGSIRATVLDSATVPVIGYDDYDPWGYTLAQRIKPIPNAYLQGASKNRFTGKERDDEYGVNWDYFGARYYDAQIGRWMARDPLAENSPSLTPYHYVRNNPLNFIDPDGLREYEDDYEGELGLGDWMVSDRRKHTQRWKDASIYNLKQKTGYSEYETIEQRAAFYEWFQSHTERLGFETRWAGTAADVARAINMLTWDMAKWFNYSSEDAAGFAEAGNRAIFEDVFVKLNSLVAGDVLKGEAAFEWDSRALAEEQNLIQPLYEATPAIGILSAAAKQRLAFSSWFSSAPPFPLMGNILNVRERWSYGMKTMGYNVNSSTMTNR